MHESTNKYHSLNFHLLKGPWFGNATDFRWHEKCQTIISHAPGQSKMSVQLSQVCTLMRITSQFFRHSIPSSWSWGGHFHTFGLILSSLFVGMLECCGQRFEMEHCIFKAYHFHVLWTTYEQKGLLSVSDCHGCTNCISTNSASLSWQNNIIHVYQHASSFSRVLGKKCLKGNALHYKCKNKTIKTTFCIKYRSTKSHYCTLFRNKLFV